MQSGDLRYLFLAEIPDTCRANKRKVMKVMRLIAGEPRIFMLPLFGCYVHVTNRIVAAALNEESAI
eukprot:129703-Pyramimonas_sp.AAC.1